ncbi:MAG: dTDP-4-dehydrorhamnose reductase [Dehalococcoidia bacterium]
MRILVTGGRGQLGRALQQALTDHQVIALGHRELEVSDAGLVRRTVEEARPELVIHAAAWTDTAGCEADPGRAQEINGEGSRHVAAACAHVGASMLYVSTNEVFDGTKVEPYHEYEETNPINAYARSKLEGERHVRALLDRRYVIVRTSWLYGFGRSSFPEKIVQAALDKGALKVVTDEVASPTWTVDLARGIALIIRQPAWGVYHLTNSGYCSRLDWARKMLDLAGLGHIRLEPITQAEFGLPYRKPAFSVLANRTAARLGAQLRPWQDALSEYLEEKKGAFPTANSGA